MRQNHPDNGAQVGKERNIAYDYIRVMACICVIGIHATGRGTYDFTDKWQVIDFMIHSFARIGLPVFFLLSGALLLNSTRKEGIGEFYARRFIKIIIPFLLYSLFYVLWVNPQYQLTDILKTDTWKTMAGDFFPAIMAILETAQTIPLWFVYSITGIYIVAPFIKIMVQNMNEKYLKGLALVLIITRCLVNYFPLLFGFKPGISFIFSGWIAYFLLGYVIVQDFVTPYYKYIEAGGVIAYMVSAFIAARLPGLRSENYYDLAPHMMLQAAAFFVCFYRRESRLAKNLRLNRLVNLLAKYTFSIYIIHTFVMREVNKLYVLNGMIENIIAVNLIRIVLVFLGGFLITFAVDNTIIKFVQWACEGIGQKLRSNRHNVD